MSLNSPTSPERPMEAVVNRETPSPCLASCVIVSIYGALRLLVSEVTPSTKIS